MAKNTSKVEALVSKVLGGMGAGAEWAQANESGIKRALVYTHPAVILGAAGALVAVCSIVLAAAVAGWATFMGTLVFLAVKASAQASREAVAGWFARLSAPESPALAWEVADASEEATAPESAPVVLVPAPAPAPADLLDGFRAEVAAALDAFRAEVAVIFAPVGPTLAAEVPAPSRRVALPLVSAPAPAPVPTVAQLTEAARQEVAAWDALVNEVDGPVAVAACSPAPESAPAAPAVKATRKVAKAPGKGKGKAAASKPAPAACPRLDRADCSALNRPALQRLATANGLPATGSKVALLDLLCGPVS